MIIQLLIRYQQTRYTRVKTNTVINEVNDNIN
jgi:hypothetical protein